jgi:hypothetical protein
METTMHFSNFTSYMLQNRRSVSNSLWQQVRREGIARVAERLQTGRADSELTFNDLIERIESAICPK